MLKADGRKDLETKMKKILVTGAEGLVGSGIVKLSAEYPEYSFTFANRYLADLTDEKQVKLLFDLLKPDYVLHTAARVGGIGRNLNSPVQQFNDNILMNTNVIKQAHEHGVEKLIAFSSVCVFPGSSSFIREDIMHDGPPFPAHWSYAMAKRMVDVQIDAYRKQYGANYCSVIPVNIFGESDNYNLEDGHVLPSLIHKCFLAKQQNKPLEVWGDGESFREFIYSRDVAEICLNLFDKDKMPQRIITPGVEKQIKEIVTYVCDAFDYHNVFYDTTKPNGQRRRETDRALFDKEFPNFQYSDLAKSIKKSVDWFVQNYPNIRK